MQAEFNFTSGIDGKDYTVIFFSGSLDVTEDGLRTWESVTGSNEAVYHFRAWNDESFENRKKLAEFIEKQESKP